MNQEADEAFKKVKEIYEEDALLFYPDFSQPFKIRTDASEFQMGGVISQNGNVIAYWSLKLSETQKRYHTIE